MRSFRTVAAALAGLVLAGAAGAASAQSAADTTTTYRVVDSDARIPYAGDVYNYEQLDDGTFLLKAGTRTYLAHVNPDCGRDARLSYRIGLESRSAFGLQRNSILVLDEWRRCRIQLLERVVRDS